MCVCVCNVHVCLCLHPDMWMKVLTCRKVFVREHWLSALPFEILLRQALLAFLLSGKKLISQEDSMNSPFFSPHLAMGTQNYKLSYHVAKFYIYCGIWAQTPILWLSIELYLQSYILRMSTWIEKWLKGDQNHFISSKDKLTCPLNPTVFCSLQRILISLNRNIILKLKLSYDFYLTARV